MAVYTVRVSFDPGAVDLDFLTQAYFTVLAEVMGREPLSDPPRRREGKSDYGPPPWKSRTYGGTKYGLRARDDLLFTGHGVYGEKTRWTQLVQRFLLEYGVDHFDISLKKNNRGNCAVDYSINII